MEGVSISFVSKSSIEIDLEEKIVYLNSGKCNWGQCVFCGWGTYEYPKLSFDELREWFDKKIEEVDILKIFNLVLVYFLNY